MFPPLDPPAGAPQYTGYSDGPNGPSAFPFPGVGAIARGNLGGVNPRAALIQALLGQAQNQQTPHSHPMIPYGAPQQGVPDLINSLQGRQNQQELPMTHFNQVHMAQALARFLAQQHTAGLRRYNGHT